MTPCTTTSLANVACWSHDFAELKPDASLKEHAFRPRKKTAPRWHRDHPRQTQKSKTKRTALKAAQLQLAAHPVERQESGMRQS